MFFAVLNLYVKVLLLYFMQNSELLLISEVAKNNLYSVLFSFGLHFLLFFSIMLCVFESCKKLYINQISYYH